MFGKNKTKTDRQSIREERFKKIASRRVQEILDKMRLLKNCANKANYSYSEQQARKIVNTIEDEWKSVKHEFNKNKSKKREFSLD